jgi:DNA-binding NarL/FixJ family response regulator
MKTQSKIKVFLADDTLIAREGWKRILETSENILVVGEASNAHEVSQKIKELNPDIVLMDLKWFGDDTAGQAAIREIKALSMNAKVIAITAFENLIHDARMAGADAALTKTFSREELLNLINVLATKETNFQLPETITPYNAVTPREQEVLLHLSKGHSDKEIAKNLGIATTTVKNHVKNIREKLGAKNRTQAVNIARELNLIK